MTNYKFTEKDYPTKGYFHFDYPVHISEVKSYVQNPNQIAEHSFFPLMAYEQEMEKFVTDPLDYEDGRPYKKDSRPIKYAGHLDGYIYKYYANKLNVAYNIWAHDKGIDECSIAYRTNKKGKSNIDFAAEVINYIANHRDAYILVGDFKGYFDSFNHFILKESIYEVLNTDYLPDDWFNVFKSVTKYGFAEKDFVEAYFGNEGLLRQQGHRKFTSKDKTISDFRETDKIKTNKDILRGVPQGVPISAVMANVYATNFDIKINSIVQKNNGLYRRYSDDFIIVLPSSGRGEETEEQFRNILERVKDVVKEDKLELSERKTNFYKKSGNDIFKIVNGFSLEKSAIDYLGFVYDGLNVTIRQRSIERFYRKMKKTVKTMEGKRRRHNRKGKKPIMKRIPHRNRIYGLFTDKGFKEGNGRSKSNFIEYAKRSQKIFDQISKNTNNQMMDQIKNRKKKLEKLLGSRIYVRQTRD